MLQKTLGRTKVPVVARFTGLCFLLWWSVVPRMRQGSLPSFHDRVVPWRYASRLSKNADSRPAGRVHVSDRETLACIAFAHDSPWLCLLCFQSGLHLPSLPTAFFRAVAGIEWILEECSSHGASAFVAFVCFTSFMLAAQLHKVSRIVFAPSIDSVRSTLGFQVLFSLIFVVSRTCSPTVPNTPRMHTQSLYPRGSRA